MDQDGKLKIVFTQTITVAFGVRIPAAPMAFKAGQNGLFSCSCPEFNAGRGRLFLEQAVRRSSRRRFLKFVTNHEEEISAESA